MCVPMLRWSPLFLTGEYRFTGALERSKQPQLATFTLFPLSLVQEAGDNGTEKLLITLNHVSCTNYFMSIEMSWCGVRLIKIAKPDKKNSVAKTHCIFSIWRNNYTLPGYRKRLRAVILIPRMQTSRRYEFMGVNPPSFPSIPPHSNHSARTHHKPMESWTWSNNDVTSRLTYWRA